VLGLRLSLEHDSAINGVSELILGKVSDGPVEAVKGYLRLVNANITSMQTLRIVNGAMEVHGTTGIHLVTFELATAGTVLGTGFSHTNNGQGEGKGAGATAGASHGGLAYGSPQPYGVVKQPTTVGSGASRTRGGAAIHISANTVTLNGLIASDGTYSTGSGGGSGGSVWIAAGVLKGSGATIQAQGGQGYSSSRAGGGGGRVALTCTSSVYSGGTWAGWTDVPTIKIGGGGTGHSGYPQYAAGSGTAYVDCGAAANALVV